MSTGDLFAPLGVTADLVAGLINTDHRDRPRSQQQAIGPSQIGAPCARQTGHRIVGTPQPDTAADMLPAWIGTEAHAGMARILDGHPDWVAEQRITLPDPELGAITGTADAYHRPSGTVVDWKFTSAAQVAKYKAAGPGSQYRTQIQLYGTGVSLLGWPVERVAIVFIPRAGLSGGIHVWSEPYDQAATDAALDRLAAIRTIALGVGPDALPTADGPCAWCPWMGSACEGHTATQ